MAKAQVSKAACMSQNGAASALDSIKTPDCDGSHLVLDDFDRRLQYLRDRSATLSAQLNPALGLAGH